jgi:hypothetical protein
LQNSGLISLGDELSRTVMPATSSFSASTDKKFERIVS